MTNDSKLLYSTDPEDYGYKWCSNLQGYYHSEDAELDPADLKPLYDRFTGKRCGWVDSNGNEYDCDLSDYGIYECIDDVFDEDFAQLKTVFNSAPYGFVASGSCGLWDGRRAGGKFIDDLRELQDTISGYDDVKITDERGIIHIEMHHHDGTNVLDLKEVTKAGYDWRCENEYDLGRRELVETVFNNPHYSKLPNANAVLYGTPAYARKPKAAKRKFGRKACAPKSKGKCASKCTKPMVRSIPKKPAAKKAPSKDLKSAIGKKPARKAPAKKVTPRRK